MWKQALTGLLLVAACVQASSTLEELRQLEAHKTTPGKASQVQTAATSSSPVAPAVPERRDYRLPDGRVVNLKTTNWCCSCSPAVVTASSLTRY